MRQIRIERVLRMGMTSASIRGVPIYPAGLGVVEDFGG
jgi:hypothetical protein